MMLIGVLVILAGLTPFLVAQIRQERKQQEWASQLRESLQSLVHGLRVGVGFNQALEYAAKEGAMPLAGEWQRVLQSVRVGQSLAQALQEVAERVPIKEMAWFSTAVQITQATGGSLAEVLESLSITLQDQQSLREKVSALTAQGKASGILLSLLPFLMMGAMSFVAPEITKPLFVTSTGQNVIAGVIVSVAMGAFAIKKIVTVRVDEI